MSQCLRCKYGGYVYEFSTSTFPANFDFAQQLCENNGGTLARYLDEDAYVELRKCCQNGAHYWIGLVENRLCTSSAVGRYTWVDDTACTSGRPLKVIELPNSVQSSQAVSILLNSDNLEKPPEAREKYDSEQQRYICQYSIATSTAAEASSPTTDCTDDATSFSTMTDTSFPAVDKTTKAESAETTLTSFTTQSQEATSVSSTAIDTSNVSTSTTTSSVTDGHDATGLIAGLVIGGILLIMALLLFYLFFYKNGYYKKFKYASSPTTTSFTTNDDKDNKTKEVKENPLYGRVTATSETYQVCYGVHNDSVTGLGSNHENEYQMGDDEISNEYHAIPGHTNNDQNPSSNYYIIPDPSKPSVEYTLVQKKKNPDPSNEYNFPGKPQNTSSHSNENQLDCVENDYNKLYFPQLQDDGTSSTYARLNHENNSPPSNNINLSAITQ